MRLIDAIKSKNSNLFCFSSIITIILAYGFAMFNCTISVDNENLARLLDWRLFEQVILDLILLILFLV